MTEARFASYLLRGLVLGAAILGVGGRLLMAGFSLILGLPLGFTVRGSAAVVATGAVYGLLGGAVCWTVDRARRITAVPRAALSGLILFLLIAAVSIPNDQAGAALEHPVLSTVLFLPLTIAFAAAVRRRRRDSASSGV
jgi:hypothetical protein